MRRAATVMILALGAAVPAAAISPACAQTAPGTGNNAASDVSAQSRQPARARTRIRVAPAYPYRTYSTTYPVPYKYDYPGPGAVRQCTSWLATENRLSGTVLTPQMRCWWQPGG